MSYELQIDYNDLISTYSKNHKLGDKLPIKRAYDYAAKEHAGAKRDTGEPYIFHPLRVANLVAEWGFESDVVIAALLHDVVEDCKIPLSTIKDEFGNRVANTVDAVTALSDKDFDEKELSKEQIDILSDAHLQSKMNEKALYVKIADRIDNLNTLWGVKEEKRIPKSVHTREIIIPMAKIMGAYRFVDELEELCFKTEHAKMYEDMTKQCRLLLKANNRKIDQSLNILSDIFNPRFNNEASELDRYHRYIVDFTHNPRSYISIYRQISSKAENLKNDWRSLLSKEHVALNDLTLIVQDDLSNPHDLFFKYFEKSLSKKGFYLVRYCYTTYKDAGYFLITDETDNLYRLFVRTESEYQRYMYGNIVDEDNTFCLSHVNKLDPRDTYKEKIKVFRKDGSEMYIDKGATVLDFAFHIHSDLGYHFACAKLYGSNTALPKHTLLNEGDMITIEKDDGIEPGISWFRHVKTRKAVDYLVKYFTPKDKIKVFRKDGSEMYIDKGATVLDFAFHIHSYLGYHYDYATLYGSEAKLPPYTPLKEGDRITIETNDNTEPKISWFKHVKTSKAMDCLVEYFSSILT